jgi:hypothetical protein
MGRKGKEGRREREKGNRERESDDSALNPSRL